MMSSPYLNALKCADCSMTFESPSLLTKHRQKFCVGSVTYGSSQDNTSYARTTIAEDDRSFMSSAISNSSMSIHLPSGSNSPRDSKMREFTNAHNKNMTRLQAQNAELEKQKEGIRRRLDQLSRQGGSPNFNLLDELRRQEDRNQATLAELKQQLSHIHAFRQEYISQGGSDSEVLRQTTNMMREAQLLDNLKRDSPTNVKSDVTRNQLYGVELENQRLHTELLLLQQRNLMAQQNRGSNDGDDEMKTLQKEHLRKLTLLQNEMELLKHQAELERYKRELGMEKQPPVESRRSRTPPREREPSPLIPTPPPQQQPAYNPQAEEAELPYLLTGHAPFGTYPNYSIKYDQNAGFVIFYDFILGLDPTLNSCRLAIALRTSDAEIGTASVLPTVYTEYTGSTLQQPSLYNTSCALIAAKQPVPNCLPLPDLGLLIEFQASSTSSQHHLSRLMTRAWTKIQLFDPSHHLIAGYYRVPLRLTPLQPELTFQHISNLHKFGDCELFYRILHERDSNKQSLLPVSIHNHPSYRYPPIHQIDPPKPVVPPPILPPPTTTPPVTPAYVKPRPQKSPLVSRHASPQPTRPPPPPPPPPPRPSEERTIALQVHRLKHCATGEARVSLTAYYPSTGKVVESKSSAVTCSTTPALNTYMYTYHIFGEQEAVFSGVVMQRDMVLLVKVYLTPGSVDDLFNGKDFAKEELVAWSFLCLVVKQENAQDNLGSFYDPDSMQINVGQHVLPLYQPPAPLPTELPLDSSKSSSGWSRYRRATVKVNVSHGTPRPQSPTYSDLSDLGDANIPSSAWLKQSVSCHPSEAYVAGDGFDIYIDGCRFLPDCVTFSRVAGRVLDSTMNVLTPDIFTNIHLDSDVYNPVYGHRQEVRKKLIPSAILVLKVYTIGAYDPQLTTVGYALLNLFVETESDKPASANSTKMSVNEGAHQLRLYSCGPSNEGPLTESCLRDARVRPVPCASILVRLHKVARGPNKKVPLAEKVAQSQWEALGLWHKMPAYSDCVYDSTKCVPTPGEVAMFASMIDRQPLSVNDALTQFTKGSRTRLDSQKDIDLFIKNKLTRQADVEPLDINLQHICPYSPVHGFKVKIDSAQNIPWESFTLVHTCFNPPASFYQGPPHVSYDHLSFTEHLHPECTTSAPVWQDQFKHFPYRSYHQNLTLVVHLQEIQVNTTTKNYKYGLVDEAWTVVPAFSREHAHTAAFLMPLFAGAPTQDMLAELAHEPTRTWLERSINSGQIKLLKGASVFVLLADARRVEEIDFETVSTSQAHVNRDFIPDKFINSYKPNIQGTRIQDIIPEGKSSQEFLDGLGKRFKKLVYKWYEEDGSSQ